MVLAGKARSVDHGKDRWIPQGSLSNGKSETTIDVPLASLQAGGFAINGHKSAQEASIYVFCGAIPAQ